MEINEFYKLRLDVAIQMLENIYSDLCKESTADVSRETTYDFLHFIIDIRKFASQFDRQIKEESLENQILKAQEKTDVLGPEKIVPDLER